jgi:hypothetical protein
MNSNRYRMMTWGLGLVLAGWLLVGLVGCCNRGPGWFCCGKNTERDYGHSVEHNLASQLVDPTAGQEVYVSRGQTPEATANAYEKYNKTFKPEEKKPVFSLTTGGGY